MTRPYPGAFTAIDGRRLLVWWGLPAARRPGDGNAAPGTVLGARQGGVAVAAGEGAFVVIEAQTEGRTPVSGAKALAALLPVGQRLPS